MSQLKKGAILSYVSILLTNIIGLVLTPFIIRSLGDSEYGLYILIGGVIGYISILDLGLNNAIIRYVSKYRAENDKSGEESFLATTMVIYGIISVVVVLIGGFIYFNIENIFVNSLTIDELDKAKIMFQILIFNLAITLPRGAFIAICNAYENFVFPRALNIVKYISRSLLIYFVLLYGGDAIAMVWIDTILNVVIIGITAFYVFKKLRVTFRFADKVDLALVKDIFSYSVWIFLYALVLQLQWNAGQTILGIQSDTVTVAIFGVGILLGGYYGAFASVINTLLLPKATQMTVRNADGATYTNAMVKVGRINFVILLLILSGFFLFGKAFIQLWLTANYLPSWHIAMLIMLVMTLPLVQGFGNSILEAKKKNKFKAVLSITILSVAVVLGFFLSKSYGMYGVLLPITTGLLINSLVMLYYFKKVFKLTVGIFLKDTFLKPILVNIGLVVLVFWLLQEFVVIATWFALLIGISSYVSCYLLLAYLFILSKEEKKIVGL